jgi:hypothetical protein
MSAAAPGATAAREDAVHLAETAVARLGEIIIGKEQPLRCASPACSRAVTC